MAGTTRKPRKKKRYVPKASRKDPHPGDILVGELIVDEEGVPYADQGAIRAKPRTTAIRKRDPARRKQIRNRIEEVRGMLAIGMSMGDIKRVCSERWGVKERSVEKYHNVARKFNRQVFQTSHEDAKADSQRFWTMKIAQLQSERVEAKRLIQNGQRMMAEANALLDSGELTPFARLQALKLLKDGERIEGKGHYRIGTIENHIHSVRMRLDKILGVDAPLRVSTVGDDGKSVNPSADQILHGKELDLALAATLAEMGYQLLPLSPENGAPVEEQFPLITDQTLGVPVEHAGNVRPHTTADKTGDVARGHTVDHLPPHAREAKLKMQAAMDRAKHQNGNGHK